MSSVSYFAMSSSVLHSEKYWCIEGVCSLRKWSRTFGAIRLVKGELSDEGTHNQEESEGLRKNESAQWKPRLINILVFSPT